MYKNEFYKGFEDLNIAVTPLPANYTPEEFGRKLLADNKTFQGVSYASSTDYRDSGYITS